MVMSAVKSSLQLFRQMYRECCKFSSYNFRYIPILLEGGSIAQYFILLFIVPLREYSKRKVRYLWEKNKNATGEEVLNLFNLNRCNLKFFWW
jgi:hypothetical protein